MLDKKLSIGIIRWKRQDEYEDNFFKEVLAKIVFLLTQLSHISNEVDFNLYRVVIILLAIFLLITSLSHLFFNYELSSWVEYANLIIVLILVIDLFKKKKEN